MRTRNSSKPEAADPHLTDGSAIGIGDKGRIDKNDMRVRARLSGPTHLGLKTGLCAPHSVLGYRSPVPLAKFQMAPTPSTPISSGFKKKEPRYLSLSEANASHSHKMCTEVSSSVPHFLHVGSALSPITCRCLLRVLCPVSRPVTALDCVLLKDNNMARFGPEINSRTCLCVPQGPRQGVVLVSGLLGLSPFWGYLGRT
jgi:hypothetical protein